MSVLLRNRMAERLASVSEDELCQIIEERDSINKKYIMINYNCIIKFFK